MDWNILGHEWAVDLLSQQIAQGRIHHAYLITGPKGVGRLNLAVRLSQALICPNPPQAGQACLVCPTCTRVERLQHPDLILIQPEQNSKVLKVDQVREVQHTLALTPYEARYKILLFVDFQVALASVPNALLKTLEEPPSQVIIILIADDSENLLPTITSRCEVIRLRPLSLEKVAQGLCQRWGLSVEQAEILAHISSGLPAVAINLHEQPELLDRRKQWLEDFCQLLAGSRVERFAFARAAKEDKDGIKQELRMWVSLWRDVLLTIAGSTVPLVNQDWKNEIEELAAQIDFPQACQLLGRIEQTINRLEYSNINLQLALEAMLLDFPYIQVSIRS